MQSRMVAGEEDYELMRTMLQRSGVVSGPRVTMTVGDLDFWRHQRDSPPLERTCRLWLDATEDVAGFAWATPGSIDVAVSPEARDLVSPMMEWAEELLRAQEGPGSEVAAAALDTDPDHEAELVRRRYRRTDAFHWWYRMRELGASVESCELPDGYVLQTVAAACAWADVADLIERTRAAPVFTAEGWRALMSSRTYVPELDLIAFARDGRPVAHCTAWLDPANCTLLIEPLGCHSEHRRRGVARALVLESLRRGQGMGAKTALVASDGRNEGANALYESLGFRADARKWVWTKRLHHA